MHLFVILKVISETSFMKYILYNKCLSITESVSARIKPVEGRIREGDTLYLTCDGQGFPPPTVRWEKMGVELVTTGRMTVNGANLRITSVTLDDTGSYTCVANNAEEKSEDSKSIQVIPKGQL